MEALVFLLALHWRKVLAIIALAVVIGTVRDAIADPVIGRAAVIDGDTIEIRGERIRLNGIDAPEGQQLCQDAKGKDYRCGQTSAKALDKFLSQSRPTRCEFVERDQYDRFVGDCYRADGVSIASWMVRNGHALDWPQYSRGAHAMEQHAAKSERIGMWAGRFVEPWEWRAQQRSASTAPRLVDIPKGSCQIKGNISKRGERIYHVPGQRDYNATRINERAGEKWFCSEDEAHKAGWRRAAR